MYNRKYDKIFIMLKQETYGYGDGQKQINGNASIELKNGTGKLSVYVQGLRQLSSGIYKIYLISSSVGKAVGIDTGKMEVDHRGQGKTKWEFDADNVAQSGLPVEEFNVVAVIAEEATGLSNTIVSPLVGYRASKINWKDHFTKFQKGDMPAKSDKNKKPQIKEESKILKDIVQPLSKEAVNETKRETTPSKEAVKETKRETTPSKEAVKETKKETTSSKEVMKETTSSKEVMKETKKETTSSKESMNEIKEENSFLKEYLQDGKINCNEDKKESILDSITLTPGIVDGSIQNLEKASFFYVDDTSKFDAELRIPTWPNLVEKPPLEQNTDKVQKCENNLQKDIKQTEQVEQPIEPKKELEQNTDFKAKEDLEKETVSQKDFKMENEFYNEFLNMKQENPHDTFKEITMKFKKELEELEKAGVFTKEEIQSIDKKGKIDEKGEQTDLDYVFSVNEKLKPFAGNQGNEWVRFSVDEMILLPLTRTSLMRHPFVICGYEKYKHLLIGKNNANGKESIFLGVPDQYQPEYKLKASHLGFQDFWRQDGEKQPAENAYGYWIMRFEKGK